MFFAYVHAYLRIFGFWLSRWHWKMAKNILAESAFFMILTLESHLTLREVKRYGCRQL